MGNPHKTFLSHNSADKPAVEALARRLRQENIEPWLDKWNLIPGNDWQEEIEQALDDCTTCCVFKYLDINISTKIAPSTLG